MTMRDWPSEPSFPGFHSLVETKQRAVEVISAQAREAVKSWRFLLRDNYHIAVVIGGILAILSGGGVGLWNWRVLEKDAATQNVSGARTSSFSQFSNDTNVTSSEEQTATRSANLVPSSSTGEGSLIAVDVSGAVRLPGVYFLPRSGRLIDGIEKAGGFLASADTRYIAQRINLAAVLKDQEKIFIPARGEIDSAAIPEENSSNDEVIKDESGGVPTSKISVNSAPISQLDEIPGLGEKRVKDIEANRPYASLEEVPEKANLSEALWKKITPYLTL